MPPLTAPPKRSRIGRLAVTSGLSSRDLADAFCLLRAQGDVPARVRSGPVESRFATARGVHHGGVLVALPYLLKKGPLVQTGRLPALPTGCNGLLEFLLLLTFMTLARERNHASLRCEAPGEWSVLLGLDRRPEVKVSVSQTTATGTFFPGTDLRVVRDIGETPKSAQTASPHISRNKEV